MDLIDLEAQRQEAIDEQLREGLEGPRTGVDAPKCGFKIDGSFFCVLWPGHPPPCMDYIGRDGKPVQGIYSGEFTGPEDGECLVCGDLIGEHHEGIFCHPVTEDD